MGSGIRLANADNPELAKALEDMQDQVVIALVRRLGGKVRLPVREVDDTGRYLLELELDQTPGKEPAFVYHLRKKS
jgi:hypothetical protein